MTNKEIVSESENQPIQEIGKIFISKFGNNWDKKYTRLILSALGSIPWVGGVFSAAALMASEKSQQNINSLHRLWLEEHEQKIEYLAAALSAIILRFESFGDEINDRLQSEEYLALVGDAFRTWDRAVTDEKRELVKQLLINAGAVKLCSDDLIRLFIDWIDRYHEAHFAVIREIYNNEGITRGEIWDSLRGEEVREDSADADLFKLLFRDLSTGGVIRQDKEKTSSGQFLRQRGKTKSKSDVTTSAFEDSKGYILTELGREFVHYVIEDAAPQIKDKN